jgi:peptide-methionine (S)-S-oxide reductase
MLSLVIVTAPRLARDAPAQLEVGPSPPLPAGDGKDGDKAKDKAEDKSQKSKPSGPQVATFGGGCFWCIEAVFEQVPGVLSAVSGYAGGTVPFPSYDMVHTGLTGHAEVVQVVFDPKVVSYEKLLELFWRVHDPTTPNAQGPDVGPQYRSIILYHNEAQKKAAETMYRELKARRVLKGTVVTQLVPFRAFFPAEPYHQDYYANHPFDPYSMVYIAPKFDYLRKVKWKQATSGSGRGGDPKNSKKKATVTPKATGGRADDPGPSRKE